MAEKNDWRELLNENIISRFPRYLRKIKLKAAAGEFRISSAALAEEMGYKPSQVRQDLRVLASRSDSGNAGTNGYGYNPHRLYNELVELMGINDRYSAIIIGNGPFSEAMARLPLFTRHGVKLAGRVSNAIELNEWCSKRREPFPEIAVVVTDDIPFDAACMAATKGAKVIVNFNDIEIRPAAFNGISVINFSISDILVSACFGLVIDEVDSSRDAASPDATR